MINLERIDNESFLSYAERLINNRIEYDLDKTEVYELLLGKQVSSDHARKCLTNTLDIIEASKQITTEDKLIHKEFNDKDLKKELGRNYKETIELNNDGSQSSDKLLLLSEENCKDVNFLLKAHGYSTTEWELISARNNIWNVYSCQDGIQEIYSSKIVVKPKQTIFDADWIQDVISKINFKTNFIKYDYTYCLNNDAKVVEINFCDVHIGKFVNAIVSNGVYDANIAVNRFKESIDKAISRVGIYNVKKFIFITGQDYLNFDNFLGTTTKGTRQDMNDFFETVYKKALDCLIETIEKLRAIAPVEIIYVKGNHDSFTTFSMCQALYNMYKFNNINSVSVDYSTLQRKYRKIGNCTVGFGHGEKEKNRIVNCMQTDAPELWNNKFRFFHLSHFHSEKSKEVGGVIYRWLGSLSENCKWTYESGFVGAQKKGHVFVYDENEGLWDEFFINVLN